MNKGILIPAVAAVFALSSLPAQAKVKSVAAKIVTPTSASKVLTGKATPGAKVKVTRYKILYGSGTVNKKGRVRVSLKYKLKVGAHYRVTVSKKGYHSIKMYVGIPRKNTNNTVDSSSKQETQNVISNPTTTETTELPTSVQPTSGDTVKIRQAKEDYKAVSVKVAALQTEIAQLEQQMDKVDKESIQMQDDVIDYWLNYVENKNKMPSLDTIQNRVKALQVAVVTAKTAEEKTNAEYALSLEKENFSNTLQVMQDKIAAIKRVNHDPQHYQDLINEKNQEFTALTQQRDALNTQLTSLQSMKDALLTTILTN